MAVSVGRLIGVGVGPGDPELLTLKAVRRLREADVVAYVGADGAPSLARAVAAEHLGGKREMALDLPMRSDPRPAGLVYDVAAARLAAELDAGRTVAVLCEGDPLLYGSFTQLMRRLAGYPTEVVPGIASMTAAAAAARWPIAEREQVFSVLPATLSDDALAAGIEACHAAAIIKLGRHLGRVRRALDAAGRLAGAVYVERATTPGEAVRPLAAVTGERAPYFALVLTRRGEPA